MSDFLLELSKNPRARALVGALGLPIPLPQPLKRDLGPWQQRPLADARVAVGAAGGAELVRRPRRVADGGRRRRLRRRARLARVGLPRARARRSAARRRSSIRWREGTKLNALVFDATGVVDVKALRGVYEFFQPLVSQLARSARVVVLARPPEGSSPEAAAVQCGARRLRPQRGQGDRPGRRDREPDPRRAGEPRAGSGRCSASCSRRARRS